MNFAKITRLAALLLAMLLLSGCMLFNPKSAFDEGDAQAVMLEAEETPMPAETPAPPVAIVPEETPTPTPEPTVDPSIEVTQSADADFMQNRVNILLLGLDRSRERANWGSFRTDTIVLVSVNFDDGSVNMISIPRDSYVRIYGKEEKFSKINTAFSSGGGLEGNGYKYTVNTVSALLGGIKINYYVGFDMQVVKDVVNAMGGIDYDVDIDVTMNGRTLSPGMQHLDGQAVLDYSRQRKGSSDVARVGRQQQVLMAIFDQLKSTDQIFHIPGIYMAVAKNIDTNLSFAQICALAVQAAKTDRSQIQRDVVAGEFLDMDKLSYWGIDQAKLKKLVKSVFGVNLAIDEAIDVKAIKQRLSEESAELDSQRELANSYIRKANTLINTGRLEEYQAAALQNAIDELQRAMDDGDSAHFQQALALMEETYDAVTEATGIKVVPADSKGAETSDEGVPDEEGIADETVPDDEIPDDEIMTIE